MRDLSDWLAMAVLLIIVLVIILLAVTIGQAKPHPANWAPKEISVNLAPGCVKLPYYMCIKDRCGYVWIMNCGKAG